jgi:hypothetical protein
MLNNYQALLERKTVRDFGRTIDASPERPVGKDLNYPALLEPYAE